MVRSLPPGLYGCLQKSFTLCHDARILEEKNRKAPPEELGKGLHEDVFVVAKTGTEHFHQSLVDSHHLHEVVLAFTAVEVLDLVQQPFESHDNDCGGHVAPQIPLHV